MSISTLFLSLIRNSAGKSLTRFRSRSKAELSCPIAGSGSIKSAPISLKQQAQGLDRITRAQSLVSAQRNSAQEKETFDVQNQSSHTDVHSSSRTVDGPGREGIRLFYGTFDWYFVAVWKSAFGDLEWNYRNRSGTNRTGYRDLDSRSIPSGVKFSP
jgi:hypothetical protein